MYFSSRGFYVDSDHFLPYKLLVTPIWLITNQQHRTPTFLGHECGNDNLRWNSMLQRNFMSFHAYEIHFYFILSFMNTFGAVKCDLFIFLQFCVSTRIFLPTFQIWTQALFTSFDPKYPLFFFIQYSKVLS